MFIICDVIFFFLISYNSILYLFVEYVLCEILWQFALIVVSILGMYGGMQGPYGNMSSNNPGYYNQNANMYGGPGAPMAPPPQLQQQAMPQPPRDEIMIMVPNSAVGALIGAAGSHIKQIIRDSNAYVTVSIY